MKKDNKALIILTPGFPRDEADTACLPFLQNFIQELNEQFPALKIIVLAFDYPFTASSYWWKRNKIYSFNGWIKKNIKKLFKWVRIWFRLKKIKRSENIAGLLSLWCGECAYLGSRFAKGNHLVHYCWIQGQDAKSGNNYVKRIKPKATELIAISDFIQHEFEKNHFVKPADIIPVGIRPGEFPGEIYLRNIDILGVGSLIPLKKYDLFVEIIFRIKQLLPDIRVEICGKGPEEERLKALIVKYGLQKNIAMTGELPHEEILRRMKRSKVFLHTSEYEGLAVVFMEALFAGCRVISFVQSMDHEIENWHIAGTTDEMIEKARSILSNAGIIYKPVVTYTSSDSARKIIQLFNYKEPMSC